MSATASFATQLAVTSVVAGFSATLQRVSGFGFALFATPLLALAMPVSLAVVVVAMVAFPTGALNWIELRSHADRSQVVRLVGWSIPGMPLGLLVHDRLPDTALRVALAIAVVAAAVLLASGARIRAANVRRADAVAGFMSGVLNTSTGTNGPPLVVTLAGQNLEPDRFRATLAGVFAFSGVLAIALFGLDGKLTGRAVSLGTVGVPTALVGRLAGAAVARRLGQHRFRPFVLSLLIATALVTAGRALL